jgi:hypothetical protein
LLLPSVCAQVEPGKPEAGFQAHQRGHEATIVGVVQELPKL